MGARFSSANRTDKPALACSLIYEVARAAAMESKIGGENRAPLPSQKKHA